MSRPERLALQIRRDLGELVREVKEPRVQGATLITISHVHLSPDLAVARVLVSVIADDPRGVLQGLGRAGGFLRAQLGKRMRAKKVPELRFELDETEARAGRIEAILRDLRGGEPPTDRAADEGGAADEDDEA